MPKTSNAPAGSGEGAADCQPGGDKSQYSTFGPKSKLARCLKRISADDRRWFEQHPRARWRIRPTEPGEWPTEVQGSRWTAVRSIGIGRVRIPLTGSPPPGLTDRGIDRLMGVIMPAQTKRMIAEIEAIAKEAGR
jgi:hypothetical protein